RWGAGRADGHMRADRPLDVPSPRDSGDPSGRRLAQTSPCDSGEHRAGSNQDRRYGQGESPPVDRPERRGREEQNRARSVPAPQSPAGDALEEAYEQEPGHHWGRGRYADPFERALAVRRKP